MASTTATPTRRSARTDNSTNGTAPRTRRSTGRAGTAKDGAAASAVIRASARTKTPPHALSTTLPEGVTNAKTPPATPAPEPQAPATTHAFLLMTGSEFKVHATGCKALKADLKKSSYDTPVGFSPKDEEAAVRELWDDQIRESWDGPEDEQPSVEWLRDHSYVDTVDFHSCAKLGRLPKPPKVDAAGHKRAAKTELATRAVEAIAQMVAELPADNPIVVALGGPAETAKCAAHWVHHLPADRERWVAAGLPKPNRSDWR